ELPLPGDAEAAQVGLDVVAQPVVALDERGGGGAAAEGLQSVDAGAGEDVHERPAGHGVAQDAEQRLAHALRRETHPRVDGHAELTAAEAAGDDADLRLLHDECRKSYSRR